MQSKNMIKLSDLHLRDTVRLFEGAYGIATVYRINPDGSVQVWRPYVSTSDVEYTGGVIPFIGLEDFAIHGTEVELLKRGGSVR